MIRIPSHILSSLNLSEKQARVYIAALELGQASMQDLARKSDVGRSSIYGFIEGLKQRQLIIETQKKRRRVYSATPPQQLIELERLHLQEIQELLPRLIAIDNRSRLRPQVTFYEGFDGMKNIFFNILHERKEMVGWSDYEYSKNVMGRYYETFAEERAKRNILYRVIARDTPAARERKVLENRHLREVRLMHTTDLTTEMYIYADKVAILSFRTKPPFGVLLEDSSIAHTMRAIWSNAWNALQL